MLIMAIAASITVVILLTYHVYDNNLSTHPFSTPHLQNIRSCDIKNMNLILEMLKLCVGCSFDLI